MKIKELKINGFGKLENKEIKLNDNINVIYGENEAGKSTLLRFITGMFYGLSKNKNGQIMPDIEKYKPWKKEEYSGKIKYELDNKNVFEVYRDFNKKNPKIFNENLEDIGNNFNIDKTKGNLFFYDQVGLGEEIFNASVITKQAEIKLDEKSQNGIIQKISNILGTGEDNNSYNKIVTKLKKKIMDEVGTANSKERPINVVNKRIEEIEKEKFKLEEYQEKKFQIEEIIREKKDKIVEQKEKLETLKVAGWKLESIKSEETKINVAKKLVEDTLIEIENFKNSNKIENTEKKNNKKSKKIFLMVVLILISAFSIIFFNNLMLKIIPGLISVGLFILLFFSFNKDNKLLKEEKRKYNERLHELKSKNKIQKEELSNLENNYSKSVSDIYKKYNIESKDSIYEQISEIQNNINEIALSLHTMEIDNKKASEELEKYIYLEEELENLYMEKKELEQKRFEIQKSIDTLEIAYNQMKEEITPRFTEKLSCAINKITNGKYKKVRINTLGEIIVEDKNGEYINAENLSIGTIDQLYLSLRLASLEEITKENMPIVLDEAFAYYDNERLENILKYLIQDYNNKQIIIFTCTKREKEILEKERIEYNLIEL